MPITTVPKALRERLGDEASDGLVQLISAIDDSARRDAIALAEERFERRLSEEMAKLRVEFAGFKVEIAGFKTEVVKWMFLFWIGQIAVVAALFKLLK